MSSHFARAVILLPLFGSLMRGQFPPDGKLPAADELEFAGELTRLDTLLSKANDKCAVQLQIANTYAAGGQFSEAIQRLRKVVAANLGFDPSRDPDFARLRATAEFRSILQEVNRQTPRVNNSRQVATLNSRNVRPESIAYDPKRNALFLGNTTRFEIVRCSLRGNCRAFVTANATEKGYVLGLKVDHAADAVWATNNTNGSANLRCYDLANGKLRRTASIQGKHVFNDLTISSNGVVYVTDTAEGSVYRLPLGTSKPQRIAPRHTFTAANGIAMSPDERLLYISAWENGVDVIDLQTETAIPLGHPDNICLAFIDGLYASERNLIAIQNGPMSPRIVQFTLNENRLQIAKMKVLERRNPAFDGITTGVVVRNDFYYVANPQTDKASSAEPNPLQVFSLSIDR
jgi:sugar lactone lactonase YvrE